MTKTGHNWLPLVLGPVLTSSDWFWLINGYYQLEPVITSHNPAKHSVCDFKGVCRDCTWLCGSAQRLHKTVCDCAGVYLRDFTGLNMTVQECRETLQDCMWLYRSAQRPYRNVHNWMRVHRDFTGLYMTVWECTETLQDCVCDWMGVHRDFTRLYMIAWECTKTVHDCTGVLVQEYMWLYRTEQGLPSTNDKQLCVLLWCIGWCLIVTNICVAQVISSTFKSNQESCHKIVFSHISVSSQPFLMM